MSTAEKGVFDSKGRAIFQAGPGVTYSVDLNQGLDQERLMSGHPNNVARTLESVSAEFPRGMFPKQPDTISHNGNNNGHQKPQEIFSASSLTSSGPLPQS